MIILDTIRTLLIGAESFIEMRLSPTPEENALKSAENNYNTDGDPSTPPTQAIA